MTDTTVETRVPVWDPLVRFGHWALVAAFAVAYVTGEEEREPSEWHEWAGYIAGGIVVWRLIWGFVGPRRARFSDFVVGPRQALAYLFGLFTGGARRYLGHSPAGGAMVVALLAFLALTVATGIAADQDGGSQATQAGQTATARAGSPHTVQNGEGEEREGEESFIGELHGTLANITLMLAVLHILGVALASFVHRENLARAMITGKKRADDASPNL